MTTPNKSKSAAKTRNERRKAQYRKQLQVALPAQSSKLSYGCDIPNVALEKLTGKLIVLEGADGSGRSTQIRELVDWLEGNGHATVQVGLKRSTLVSEELERAQEGNILSQTTMSLFYATDFADQLENMIIPSLKAGFIVIADRYIYTLMARDLVRGMNPIWVKNLYSIALVPDAVFYLNVSPEHLIQRNLAKTQSLDYWESGMDLGFTRDMFDSFLKYQQLIRKEFLQMKKTYKFHVINGDRPTEEVYEELRTAIDKVISG
ncbi:MAG: dTMP kinase [Verrucomicrobia bacterium]|nr:dTMP kinase [Verrucomicrobiota bacterium]